MRQTLIAAILLVLSTAMLAQPRQSASVHPETGRPFMSTFDPIVSGSHPQTWDILQDERGVIFIGNGIGITIYDGASWRTISTPNKSVVRSLAMDENGRIYAGSAHDMGYLQPDTMGTLAFVSLITHLDETERDFNDVWTTIATPDGIYFQARERVFRFRSVRVVSPFRRRDG